MTSQSAMADGNGVPVLVQSLQPTTTIFMDTFQEFTFPTIEELESSNPNPNDLHSWIKLQLTLLNGKCGVLTHYQTSPRTFPQLNLDIHKFTKNLDEYFNYISGLHERYNIPFYSSALTTDLRCSPTVPPVSANVNSAEAKPNPVAAKANSSNSATKRS